MSTGNESVAVVENEESKRITSEVFEAAYFNAIENSLSDGDVAEALYGERSSQRINQVRNRVKALDKKVFELTGEKIQMLPHEAGTRGPSGMDKNDATGFLAKLAAAKAAREAKLASEKAA